MLQLREYQQVGVRLVHQAWKSGTRRAIYCLPTGGGKRYVAVHWAMLAASRQRECLIVTDRRILVDQMSDEMDRFGVAYGFIMGGREENRVPWVQIASIQSLAERYFDKPELLPQPAIIIVDECHKSVEQYARLFAFFPEAFIVGLTATPVGAEGKSLSGIYGPLIEVAKNSDLIAQGMLLPTTVIAPSEPNIEGVRIANDREFPQAALSRKVKACTCFGNVFEEWEKHGQHRKTIIFAPGVDYCKGIAGGFGEDGDSFWKRGVDAAVIHAGTKQKERDRLLDAFESGRLPILVSVDVLREGLDCSASCGIDLQPNGQLRTYWQKLGRVKRTNSGFSEAVWIDMAGNFWRYPHPDEDPDWESVACGKSIQDVTAENRERKKERTPIRCPSCGHVRKSGPRCSACGYESTEAESVRVVRMGNGRLKEVPLIEKKQVEISTYDQKVKWWRNELFAGIKANRSFDQCKLQYKIRRNEWPPDGLPLMPERGSLDGKVKVAKLYSMRDLMQAFEREVA